MNIAKALKLKNRLAQKISEAQIDIQHENSVREDSPKRTNVESVMEEYAKLTDQLIKLKVAIFVATTPVREHILRLGELKSKVTFLKGINTTEGYVSDYEGKTLYVATYSKEDIRKIIVECEDSIDKLQEELDNFNYKNEIEV